VTGLNVVLSLIRPTFAIIPDTLFAWHSSRCRCRVSLRPLTTLNGSSNSSTTVFRSLAVIQNGRTERISRNGHPFNSFDTLRKAMTAPGSGNTVLDGEIVCLDKRGRPQFNDLLFHRGEPCFFAFDLLMSDGRDLRTERLTDRKHELRRLLSKLPASRMRYVENVERYGTALYERVCEMDLEEVLLGCLRWSSSGGGHA
jgi:hypothetical protein